MYFFSQHFYFPSALNTHHSEVFFSGFEGLNGLTGQKGEPGSATGVGPRGEKGDEGLSGLPGKKIKLQTGSQQSPSDGLAIKELK